MLLILIRRSKTRLQSETGESDEPSPHISSGPKKDYSLKEGQTFTINLPGRTNQANVSGMSNPPSSSSGTGIPLLPPPPGGAKKL